MARAKSLTIEEREERSKARVQAMNYATLFLRQKYNEEYKELYAAYLRNRGYSSDAEIKLQLKDERINA